MESKKFIISLYSSDKKSSKDFLNKLMNYHMSWWHWLPNTWLLKFQINDNENNINIDVLSELVKEHFPNTIFIINEVDINAWLGYGPNLNAASLGDEDTTKDMFSWLHKNWSDNLDIS